MNAYLDVARERGFDAVLSISNHYVTASSQYPIELDKRKLRKVPLFHRSWMDILTEAVVQKEHRGVGDPDQAYILGELIRYLSDPRSGVVNFSNMGAGWTKVKEGARTQTLRKTDADVEDVAARWDDLLRFLCLHLTMELGRDVKPVTAKNETASATRLSNLKDSLATRGLLYGVLSVPDVAGNIRITADLKARQLTWGTEFDAPKDGRSRGRVSWLVRQLGDAPDDTRVEVKIARTQASLADSLGRVRVQPEVIFPPAEREIRGFDLSLARNMGLKRDASKGSFIDSVITGTEEFYRSVLQNLRPWKPPPPKLKSKDAPILNQDEPIPDVVETEVEAAHLEKLGGSIHAPEGASADVANSEDA